MQRSVESAAQLWRTRQESGHIADSADMPLMQHIKNYKIASLRLPRIDTPNNAKSEAVFGIDFRLSGMEYDVPSPCPHSQRQRHWFRRSAEEDSRLQPCQKSVISV